MTDRILDLSSLPELTRYGASINLSELLRVHVVYAEETVWRRPKRSPRWWNLWHGRPAEERHELKSPGCIHLEFKKHGRYFQLDGRGSTVDECNGQLRAVFRAVTEAWVS